MNELIFLLYILFVSSASLFALRHGKELLISLICLQCVLVNLFVTKEITLFGLTATASDALGVGASLCLNLLQEYYGRSVAQKTIWLSFFCVAFYIVASLMHVSFIPAITDVSQSHFIALLSPMPRIVIASMIVYLITQHLECHLYAFFCKKFNNRRFVIRNYSSVAITQLVDTILFSFLGLYRLNSSFNTISVIIDIIIVSYMIKLIVLFIAAPFLAVSKKLVIK